MIHGGLRAERGAVEPAGEIGGDGICESEGAAAEGIGDQRCPDEQVGAGGDDRVGAGGAGEREPELFIGEARAGGGQVGD